LFASGCAVSRLSNPFKSGSEDASASAVTPDRLLETAKADTGTDLPGGSSSHCPQVVAWPRDRLLTIYQPDHVGDANSIVHRGEISKLARECQLYSDRVIVKYGFAGRVLLGPKGGPGTVTLGVSVRVAGAQQNTLATDKMSVTPPSRRTARPAISPWSARSPSPSWWAPGLRTIRCSSPSTATSPARGNGKYWPFPPPVVRPVIDYRGPGTMVSSLPLLAKISAAFHVSEDERLSSGARFNRHR
jgi:hypothetical protein